MGRNDNKPGTEVSNRRLILIVTVGIEAVIMCPLPGERRSSMYPRCHPLELPAARFNVEIGRGVVGKSNYSLVKRKKADLLVDTRNSRNCPKSHSKQGDPCNKDVQGNS